MGRYRVSVRCSECSFERAYDGLPDARVALADHESTTGHDVTREIESLSDGVARAGADAGVCGRPECANDDSPACSPAAPRAVARTLALRRSRLFADPIRENGWRDAFGRG